ncbi:MAG: cation:proton antiporter [Planctomycetes bacterium]|nr:cation:proton antiporter [Planctomycetota bacterium]
MHDVTLLLTITVSLACALLFGAITQKLRMSPIVGYLLAGIAVGPRTPGFVADGAVAAQLAELGVILLMFGVGLHFHLDDLLRLRNVALPGALGQSALATAAMALAAGPLGLPLSAGVVLGIAIAVASTVVLARQLVDRGLLATTEGRTAIAWLVVEDLLTVVILVLLPAFAPAAPDAGGAGGAAAPAAPGFAMTLLVTLAKVGGLVVLVLVGGRKLVPKLLGAIARTRSRELFTLAVLVLALGIAVGSAELFGVSMALGAFLAGMVVGQSESSHQAAADALPMRDAFAVMFFVSVGMLFDPRSLRDDAPLVLAVLGVVLLVKPLAALLIVLFCGKPLRTGLTVAAGLAQVGEFSFIVSELARAHGLVGGEASSAIVTASIVSITLNPLLFRAVEPAERWLRGQRWLRRRRLFARSFAEATPADAAAATGAGARAVVVGYGPVGQTLTRLLREFDLATVVIDLNFDTVKRLRRDGIAAIWGDASQRELLEAAGVATADFVLVTLPDPATRDPVIEAIRTLHPGARVLVRAQRLQERESLARRGVEAVAYEEAEVGVALAALLLRAIGVPPATIAARTEQVRRETSLAVPLAAPLEGERPVETRS